MAVPRVLILVPAGGAGGRLAPLTAERAKPALPFAGSYRLIDVVPSSCRHSGVSGAWVVQQNNPASSWAHLADGRPCGLDADGWPVLTRLSHQAPARVPAGVSVADSLLAPGCVVAGEVERAVVASDVEVRAGSSVGGADDDVTLLSRDS